MNVIRYIILICCAALDIGLFFFGVIGLITFAGDPYTSVPAALVVSWTLGALILAGLTIWSFYRTVKRKKMPVLYGFFWKIVTVMLVLSATWFSLEIPEAGWLALGLGAVFGAMAFFLPKFWGSTQALGASGSQAGHAGPAVEVPAFRADKAEWAWEEAAAEYFRLRGTVYDIDDREQYKLFQERIGGMEPGESDRIYDYAGMPIACFLGWLIRRDLISDDFRSLHDPELLQAVKNETKTPLDVFRNMDYVLSKDDIKQEAMPFVNFYYNAEGNSGSFKHSTRKYFFDYYRAVCSRFDVPRYYCVDFTRESFHVLAKILDQRYLEFSDYGIKEDNPEEEDRMLEYRLQRDAEHGNFCEAEAVPAQFGGTGTPRIRMTAAAAQRKEEIDEMIEALFMLKMADKYDYKIVYDGSEPNYIFISATKGDVRTFADSIRLK